MRLRSLPPTASRGRSTCCAAATCEQSEAARGPGASACVPGLPSRFRLADPDDEGERRAALAHWIADPRTPLTWRSIVNRVWQYHFGRGIVDTPNDFGRMGAQPTIPSCSTGWPASSATAGESIKQLHRLIVTSAVYRQASADNAELRQDRRRQSLPVADEPPPAGRRGDSRRDAGGQRQARPDDGRAGPSSSASRTITRRIYDYEEFDVDDPRPSAAASIGSSCAACPTRSWSRWTAPIRRMLTPSRNTTLTALQALALLNNRSWCGRRSILPSGRKALRSDTAGQIEAAYRLALGRQPTPEESQLLVALRDGTAWPTPAG